MKMIPFVAVTALLFSTSIEVASADPLTTPIEVNAGSGLNSPENPPEVEDDGGTEPVSDSPIRQPDNKIGTKKLRGEDIYNPNGKNQSIRHLFVKPGKSVTFKVGIQNDGNVVDSFKLKSKGRSLYYSVSYFLIVETTVKGEKVRKLKKVSTKKLEKGKFLLQNLEPGEQKDIVVRVTRKKLSETAKKTFTLRLTSTSLGNTAKRDTVKATVKSLKP